MQPTLDVPPPQINPQLEQPVKQSLHETRRARAFPKIAPSESGVGAVLAATAVKEAARARTMPMNFILILY